MNGQKTTHGTQRVVLQSESQRFVPTEITFISRKFEGYNILSGVGTWSIPIRYEAGRQNLNNVQIL